MNGDAYLIVDDTDAPPPRHHYIGERGRPEMLRLRRTIRKVKPGQRFDVPVADFAGITRPNRLISAISAECSRILGVGTYRARSEGDFVRVWRVA